jgi:hypothetical protein
MLPKNRLYCFSSMGAVVVPGAGVPIVGCFPFPVLTWFGRHGGDSLGLRASPVDAVSALAVKDACDDCFPFFFFLTVMSGGEIFAFATVIFSQLLCSDIKNLQDLYKRGTCWMVDEIWPLAKRWTEVSMVQERQNGPMVLLRARIMIKAVP